MADYKADHGGMGELLRSPGVRDLVVARANEGAELARNISPDAPPAGEGYVASFEVSSGVEMVARTRRAVATLANTSEYAAAVEWGWDEAHGQWSDHPGYHVLSQTADAIGD